MPKPEIARRCQSCGVSIRVRASFCPHCGKKMTRKQRGASEVKDTESLTPVLGTPEQTPNNSGSPARQPFNPEETITQPTANSTSPAPRKPPMQATIGMVHRGGGPPRHVIEDDGPNRVEKFRQMSNAMIDEASYDPSLRFVLVAAVLFVLFLLLLLFSELIT